MFQSQQLPGAALTNGATPADAQVPLGADAGQLAEGRWMAAEPDVLVFVNDVVEKAIRENEFSSCEEL